MTLQALPSPIEAAFIRACTLDVTTLKPGNVSEASPGHRMTAAQFIASAVAAAPPLCQPGRPVGDRILAAVEATRKVADCNTNLGIVLLCAPIAAAAERRVDVDEPRVAVATPVIDATDYAGRSQVLRRRLRAVLHSLTVADADGAFRAIALANPGGLGTIEEHDVHEAAAIDLKAAMVLAADRDLVARQYANDCTDLFEVGLPAWQEEHESQGNSALQRNGLPDGLLPDGLMPEGVSPESGGEVEVNRGERAARCAMQRVYLEFLARFPDSHILRKHGLTVARAVSRQARRRLRQRVADAAEAQADLARWDAQLKSEGINPGTSADLAVACAFLAEIVRSPFILAHSDPGWRYA